MMVAAPPRRPSTLSVSNETATTTGDPVVWASSGASEASGRSSSATALRSRNRRTRRTAIDRSEAPFAQSVTTVSVGTALLEEPELLQLQRLDSCARWFEVQLGEGGLRRVPGFPSGFFRWSARDRFTRVESLRPERRQRLDQIRAIRVSCGKAPFSVEEAVRELREP